MRYRILALLVGLLTTAGAATGQTVNFDQQRAPMVELAGPWRFHTGDNPAWAGPGADDSSWPLLAAGSPWSDQGSRETTGVAWYRLRVILPTQPGPLALFLPNVGDSCQVFANGRFIGQVGGLPPHPQVVYENNIFLRIPNDALTPGQPLVLAVRVWHWPRLAGVGGGLESMPRLGQAHAIAQWRGFQVREVGYHYAVAVFDFSANFLTALASLGLFLLRRKDREYLLWGISQFFWACFILIWVARAFFTVPYWDYQLLSEGLFAAASWLQLEFYRVFLRQRRQGLYWSAVGFVLLTSAAWIAEAAFPTSGLVQQLTSVTGALMQACWVGILWRGRREERLDATILLIPNSLMLLVRMARVPLAIPSLAATSWTVALAHFLNAPIRWPFPVSATDFVGDLEMLAVLIILVLRFARTRQDEERLAAELEAARAVQKVLIPDVTPSIAGFALETVYRPAAQVGGDFFQAIPTADGGALVAIGDVSGKGLPAAMTVSLLVGTLRTLAHYTQAPAEILRALNHTMLARSDGGFTTCLVLRVDPDGTVTVANAGHLAPYVGGKEIAVENGLPLGLTATATYQVSRFRLKPGERLTLLTDGIPEARNPEGVLFGFDRTAEISTQPVDAIVDKVRAFGQQDDVTVVRLGLAAAPALAGA